MCPGLVPLCTLIASSEFLHFGFGNQMDTSRHMTQWAVSHSPDFADAVGDTIPWAAAGMVAYLQAKNLCVPGWPMTARPPRTDRETTRVWRNVWEKHPLRFRVLRAVQTLSATDLAAAVAAAASRARTLKRRASKRRCASDTSGAAASAGASLSEGA